MPGRIYGRLHHRTRNDPVLLRSVGSREPAFSKRAALDQISVTGFLRSRFYTTEELEDQFHELMMKAITVPSYYVSAMTVKNAMQFWLKYPKPVIRILKGNLQTFFIDHIQQKLTALGCDIHYQKSLFRIEPEGARVARCHFRDVENGELEERKIDQFVLAVSPEKGGGLLDDALYTAAPNLANVQYLHSQPMVALDVYLNKKIPELPKEHVNLTGAQFGLSGIDISNVWTGYDTTVLNLIASDFHAVETLSDERAIGLLINEVRRFIPFEERDIDRYVLQHHINEPLFLNDIGAWHYRPEATTELGNMVLAGDYCRSRVDLVSMEAAITSGLAAAEALRIRLGIDNPVTILAWIFHKP
jgi:Flavin containing amine oxidoreductase